MHVKTVSLDVVRMLVHYGSSIGIPLKDICEEGGFDPSILEETEARIPVASYLSAWKGVEVRSGDANFGLHFAEATSDLQRGSILCAVMMNCPTVGEAIQKFARYYCLMSEMVLPQLDQQDYRALFTWDPGRPDMKLDRHVSDALLIMLLAVVRCLAGNKLDIIEIRFAYRQPEDTREHQRVFRAPLSFGASRSGIVIGREVLSGPVFLAVPGLLAAHERVAERLLERLSSRKSWADKVLRLLSRNLLKGGRPDIESVAAELAVSTRNLQYRLKEEGTTYQTLFDQVRKAIALDYMNKSDVALYEIAFLLGFSAQSSFNHAFRKWTGIKPTEYRKRALSRSSETFFAPA